MNKKSKILPEMNSLFLQRQFYNSHKKKIQQIRNKKPNPVFRQQLSILHSRRSSQNISLRSSKATLTNQTPKTQINSLPPTILQKNYSLKNSNKWMSPYKRQKQGDILRENDRIKRKIQRTKSDISPSSMQKQYQKFAKIKQRLMKYDTNPETNKSKLKSEKYLQVIQSRSRISISSKKSEIVDSSKKSNYLLNVFYQRRKQSNFSSFIKKTEEIKQKSIQNKIINFKQKLRPMINYTQLQRNMGKYNRKLKTQFSKESLKMSNSKQKISSKYFALTQIDI